MGLMGLSSFEAAIGPREERRLIEKAARKFPKEFGLRNFPGSRFRISLRSSLWDTGYYHGKPDHPPGPLLYTQIFQDGKWVDFAKGTPAELRSEIMRLR